MKDTKPNNPLNIYEIHFDLNNRLELCSISYTSSPPSLLFVVYHSSLFMNVIVDFLNTYLIMLMCAKRSLYGWYIVVMVFYIVHSKVRRHNKQQWQMKIGCLKKSNSVSNMFLSEMKWASWKFQCRQWPYFLLYMYLYKSLRLHHYYYLAIVLYIVSYDPECLCHCSFFGKW